MTSAKPQSMAAQTEAPDDLIAELARLMADDARATPPAGNEQSPPVRIPGDAVATPVPRFDFSASTNLASGRAPSTPVRIPGAEPSPAAPDQSFSFDFGLKPAAASPAPVTPVIKPSASPTPVAASPVVATAPVQQPVAARPPEPEAAPESPGMLDDDGLADLIAAELAADLEPASAPDSPVEPEAAPKPTSSADTFGVPPVFGLGSGRPAPAPVVPQREPVPDVPARPAPPTRSDDEALDPLDEIERLVGPAVRLNTPTTTTAPSVTPAPALRSLATPTLAEPVIPDVPRPQPEARTRPAPAPEPSVEVSSVDEAILAAAAATGAHIEWVNASDRPADEPEFEAEPMVAPRRRGFRMSRAVAGPLVALGLLAVAGFGLYWVLGQGGTTTGPAPLLVADDAPTKEVPEVDTTASAQQSVVFNEISGANTGADEQIVSRDQADTDAVVAANAPVSGTGVIADAGGTEVDPNQDGLVNRKVRTVTVRPDGTIVSGDDSLAGSAILPVDRPNVPEVPGADFSTPDLIASAAAEAETAAAAPAPVAEVPATPVVEPGSVVPVVDATGTPLAGRSVTVPMQRPSDFSTIAAAALATAGTPATAQQPAATAPTATPQAAAPVAAAATPGAASAYVQLSSQRTEDAARQSAQAISTRYGVLFGGAAPEIQRVDLGERGIYYRVLVPAPSREGAANICTNVRAAGGDCLLL